MSNQTTSQLSFTYEGSSLVPMVAGYLLFGVLVKTDNEAGIHTILSALHNHDDGVAVMALFAQSDTCGNASMMAQSITKDSEISDVESTVAFATAMFVQEVGGLVGLDVAIEGWLGEQVGTSVSELATLREQAHAMRIAEGAKASEASVEVKVIRVDAKGNPTDDQSATDGLSELLSKMVNDIKQGHPGKRTPTKH